MSRLMLLLFSTHSSDRTAAVQEGKFFISFNLSHKTPAPCDRQVALQMIYGPTTDGSAFRKGGRKPEEIPEFTAAGERKIQTQLSDEDEGGRYS